MRLAAFVLVLSLGAIRGAEAGHGVLLPPVPLVASDHVARLLRAGETVFVVDLRTPGEFAAGRVPGARSLPLSELAGRGREIPREIRVLLYCHCPLEQLADAHRLLAAMGYRNHTVLAEGFSGWVAGGHPIER